MKEVYLIFDINIPKTEFFCKLFEDDQSCIDVAESTKFSPRKQISLLSIIVSKYFYKRRWFGYDILIPYNMQRTHSLSQSTKHYSSIYVENYMDSEFKGENFALKQESLRIQRTTQTHNPHNRFDLSESSYFEMHQKRFYYH